jgi:TonB family protein
MKRLLLAALVTSVLSLNAHAGKLNFDTCKKPNYPEAAQKENRTGTVNAMFKVSAKGTVTEAKIAKSSGHRDLDRAVLDAISKCTFNDATEGEWVPFQYVWTLK